MLNKRFWLACAICTFINACAQRSPITAVELSPGVYKIQVVGDPSLTLADLQKKIADQAVALCDGGRLSYQSLLDLEIKPSTTDSKNTSASVNTTVVSRLVACQRLSADE